MLMRCGVHPGIWHRHHRYVARYSLGGRWVYLGSFGSLGEAVRQREAFARLRWSVKMEVAAMVASERVRTVAMSMGQMADTSCGADGM